MASLINYLALFISGYALGWSLAMGNWFLVLLNIGILALNIYVRVLINRRLENEAS